MDADALGYLERVRQAAERMSLLIDDMLTLSCVSRREIQKRPVNLSPLTSSILDELKIREPECDVQANLWAEADPSLIRSILENLLHNAWKFSQNKQNYRITFGAIVENGERIFYVRDNGSGFDMEYAQKLFGVFQRLHHSDEFPGPGIGLAPVQRIIHRHGGRVRAHGRLNEGATLLFTLSIEEGEHHETDAGATHDPSRRGKSRVLGVNPAENLLWLNSFES